MVVMMMVVYVGGGGSCDSLSKTHFFLSHCPLSPLPSGLCVASWWSLFLKGKLLSIFANAYFSVYVFICEWRVLLILDCSGQK